MEINHWISLILDGALFGSIYGMFGICLVMIYRTSSFLNFCLSQIAALVMLILSLSLKGTFNFWFLLAAIILSFPFGWGIHFGFMKFITERKNSVRSSQSLISIGLVSCLDGLSNFLFSDEPKAFPSLFGNGSFRIFDLNVSVQAIFVVGFSWLIFGLVVLFFRSSNIGLKMEAVAENTTAARLRGIRASNMLGLAWGLTTSISVLMGIFIAPVVLVYPLMFSQVFIYALIAVILGGLESPLGAIICGSLVGIVENVGSQIPFLGSELKFALVFVLTLLLLLVFPNGIFGKVDNRKI